MCLCLNQLNLLLVDCIVTIDFNLTTYFLSFLSVFCHLTHLIIDVNQPPKAHAGPDITLELPNNFVELDGSESTDDKGIVGYLWTRTADSPASGVSFHLHKYECHFQTIMK